MITDAKSLPLIHFSPPPEPREIKKIEDGLIKMVKLEKDNKKGKVNKGESDDDTDDEPSAPNWLFYPGSKDSDRGQEAGKITMDLSKGARDLDDPDMTLKFTYKPPIVDSFKSLAIKGSEVKDDEIAGGDGEADEEDTVGVGASAVEDEDSGEGSEDEDYKEDYNEEEPNSSANTDGGEEVDIDDFDWDGDA